MADYSDGGNHNFSLSDYYDYYTYEVHSFKHWEDVVDVRALNKAFIIVSIIIGVVDLLLLVTVFSAPVRERSACWYLYHLNFVIILQITFGLPRLEADLHNSFGPCMFFSFIEWTLNLVYNVNLVLMDAEILGTIMTSNSKWKSNPQKRFFISMTATWISCILFSILVKFFGHNEEANFPICFHENKTGEIMGRVVRDWILAVVVIALTVAGLALFIRTKRSPENYSAIAANHNSLQLFNEWFACFLIINVIVILNEVLLYETYMNFFMLGMFVDILLQMASFFIHISLPLNCLLLEPVRATCAKWVVTGFQIATGTQRSYQSRSSDTQMLNMEGVE